PHHGAPRRAGAARARAGHERPHVGARRRAGEPGPPPRPWSANYRPDERRARLRLRGDGAPRRARGHRGGGVLRADGAGSQRRAGPRLRGTAAGADYRPRETHARKLKKDAAGLALELDRNPDILAGLGARKGGRLLVGFAAETGDVAAEARRKLAAKYLDLIVANDVAAPGAGFGADTNAVRLLDTSGLDEALPGLDKDEVAVRVLDWVAAHRHRAGTATLRPVPGRAAPRRSPPSSGRGA